MYFNAPQHNLEAWYRDICKCNPFHGVAYTEKKSEAKIAPLGFEKMVPLWRVEPFIFLSYGQRKSPRGGAILAPFFLSIVIGTLLTLLDPKV